MTIMTVRYRIILDSCWILLAFFLDSSWIFLGFFLDSSWILLGFLDWHHFLEGLSHSCRTSCSRPIRRWVLPNAFACCDLRQIWKQNMFLACFGTVKLVFPSPLWWDFAHQVRFVPANTDQNLSNETSPLALKSTQKLLDLVALVDKLLLERKIKTWRWHPIFN